MKKGYLLIPVLLITIIIAIGTTGCKTSGVTGDIFGALNEAGSYIGIVGANMNARGWNFPTNAISWVDYVRDLQDSISEAKKLNAKTNATVRAFEAEVMSVELPKLNEAFDSNKNW